MIQMVKNEKQQSKLKKCCQNNNYKTRRSTKTLLDTDLYNTDTYCTKSAKYQRSIN